MTRGRAATQVPGAGDGGVGEGEHGVEEWRRKHRMRAAACERSWKEGPEDRADAGRMVRALAQNGVSLIFY